MLIFAEREKKEKMISIRYKLIAYSFVILLVCIVSFTATTTFYNKSIENYQVSLNNQFVLNSFFDSNRTLNSLLRSYIFSFSEEKGRDFNYFIDNLLSYLRQPVCTQ